ncbi:substrate-binding domain-containing protein [Glaciihabitans sp. UYNi722]|uniref:LacI family DNA-binding transcriptional regulator n=1 Tax=Glaciihabitans sp. UYNi722 TaxID=3156344 RepID=UPI0033954EBE
MTDTHDVGIPARTMQDVANSLGVSVSTISLALRDDPVVSIATRARVQQEALRLGYVYNRSAANLRTQRRHLVGFVVPDIANPFVAESALRLQEIVSENSQFVILANTQDSLSTQTEVLQSLAEERAAGIVLIPAIGTTRMDLAILATAPIPVVLMNRPVENSEYPYVGIDDDQVVDIAFAHLMEAHNVGTFAYFGGLASAAPRIARKSRFEWALEKAGVTEAVDWSAPTHPNADSAYEFASALISRCALPDAIICHSDSIAIGLLKAFNEAGITPADTAIVGIDGIAQSSMTTPGLTTVSVYPGSIGRTAGHLLLQPFDTDLRPQSPALEIRASCGCAPGTQRADREDAHRPRA